MKTFVTFIFSCVIVLVSCHGRAKQAVAQYEQEPKEQQKVVDTVEIEKQLIYDQHTLADSYPYKDTVRVFQWDKIRKHLTFLDSIQSNPNKWAVIQNKKNSHGRPPLPEDYKTDDYKHLADEYNVAQYQAIPLYLSDSLSEVDRYGRDGELVKILVDSSGYAKVEHVNIGKEWFIPKKYINILGDTVVFSKVIFVDRTNQNIATMEKVGTKWLVRSMNPATTGLHRPPYKQETPVGVFVLQEKIIRMDFYKDGTTEIGGSAPYANRFCGGAYIHGVPVDLPRTEQVEFSKTLGTTPLSHMCIRNATSHAKYIYGWAPVNGTLVFIFD